MKRLMVLFFTVLFLLGCATGGMKTAPEERETISVINKAAAQEEPALKTMIMDVPLLQKESRFFRDGSLDSYTLFTYNGAGNLIREEFYDGSGTIRSSSEYLLEQELPVRKDHRDAKGLLTGYVVYGYDSSNRLIREEDFNEKQEPQLSSEYQYSREGLKTRWTVRDGRGTILSYVVYNYHDGRNIKNELYGGDEKVRNVFEKQYDGSGMLVKEVSLFSSGEVEKITEYVYRDGYPVKEEHFNKAGGLERRYLFENDQHGSPLRISLENNRGIVLETVEREYSYIQKEIVVK